MSFIELTSAGGYAITPHDDTVLVPTANGIYCGGGGDIRIITPEGDDLTFTAVPAGQTIDWQAVKVMATNTTATNLIAATRPRS
jgi:hypothetical protein